MITAIFWNMATSSIALGFDGVVILAAVAVGWLPLVGALPIIRAYVPTGRLVAVLVAGVFLFMLGFRVADERETVNNLRATVATQRADIENARKSATDEKERADAIEADASNRQKDDADYIAKLEATPGCAFDPGSRRLR